MTAVTHHYVWKLAMPMIMANISIPILGMVDTAVVGHLDSAHYLGAVAIGTLIFSFLFWGFGFLRMATTGLTAQAFGNQDSSQSQQILLQAIYFALLIALFILLFQQAISQIAFHYIDSSELVKTSARQYFDIRIWSTPAILVNYVIWGWLIGNEATKSTLYLVLTVNITNIILDILFVNFLGMDVNGVALASVIAEYSGLLLGLFMLHKRGIELISFKSTLDSFNKKQPYEVLTLHGNIFLRTLCLIFSFAFFTIQSAKYGDNVLAANSVLLNFITFMAFVLDGFANATEVLSGKAIGRKNHQQLYRVVFITGILSLSMAIVFSLSYQLFGRHIITLLTSIPDVINIANQHLTWLAIAPLIGFWSYLFDGLFIGATRSREMRNTMLFSTFICYLPAWYFLQDMGNDGLWIALLIFLAARGISQACYLPLIFKFKSV